MKKTERCRGCPSRQFVDEHGRAHSDETPGDRCLSLLCAGCGDAEEKPSPAMWQQRVGQAGDTCPLHHFEPDDEPVVLMPSRPASSCLEARLRISFGHPTGLADAIEPCPFKVDRWGCKAGGDVVDVRGLYLDMKASCPARKFGPCDAPVEGPSNGV